MELTLWAANFFTAAFVAGIPHTRCYPQQRSNPREIPPGDELLSPVWGDDNLTTFTPYTQLFPAMIHATAINAPDIPNNSSPKEN